MVQKPTSGWKANAYIIFDYQSPTDFKFAGIDVSNDKIVLGHRTAAAWVVDKQAANVHLKADTYYNLLVAVNEAARLGSASAAPAAASGSDTTAA